MGVPRPRCRPRFTQRLAGNAPTARDRRRVEAREKALRAVQPAAALARRQRRASAARRSALLNTIADADSDAHRLDAYPLTSSSHALDAVDGQASDGRAARGRRRDAVGGVHDVRRRHAHRPGRSETLGQAWHINPLEEKVDSALSLTIREDDFGAGLVADASAGPGLRFAARRSSALTASSCRRAVGPTDSRGQGSSSAATSDSPARLAALRGSSRRRRLSLDADAAAHGVRAACTIATLAGAVADFQARHGIGVDSMLGNETLDALNVPADYRVAQIAANLERYRWLPRTLGQRVHPRERAAVPSRRVRQRPEVARDEGHRRPGIRGQGDAGVQRLDGVSSSSVRTGT